MKLPQQLRSVIVIACFIFFPNNSSCHPHIHNEEKMEPSFGAFGELTRESKIDESQESDPYTHRQSGLAMNEYLMGKPQTHRKPERLTMNKDFKILPQTHRKSESLTMNKGSIALPQTHRTPERLTIDKGFMDLPQTHRKPERLTMNKGSMALQQTHRTPERLTRNKNFMLLPQTHRRSRRMTTYESMILPQNDVTSKEMNLQEIIITTLQEVCDGPLAGKDVMLHVDPEVEFALDVDDFLYRSGTPMFISRPTSDFPSVYDEQQTPGIFDSEFDCNDVSSEQVNETDDDLSIDNSTGYQHIEIHPEISGAVFVYITAGNTESVKWFDTTSILALLVISLEDSCEVSTLRKISLTHRTPSVALLCPFITNRKLVKLNTKETADSSQRFEVSTWLPFHPNQKLHYLGLWSPLNFESWEDLFIDRFSSLHDCVLHVSSDNSDAPFFFSTEEDLFDGTSKRIMDALGDWMKFDATYTKLAGDDEWGELVNGTWIGMLGEVYRREKDLAINYFSVTEERARDFDFSVSHYQEGFGFSIRIPPPLPRWMSLTYPFTETVWVGILAALVLSAVTFYFLTSKNTRMSPFETFLVVAKSLMNQSGIRVPSAGHFRLFFGVWCLAAEIIVLSYTCNLIAVLTVPVYPGRIRDVEQLAKSDYRVCMLDYGEFVPEALATSDDPEFFALGSRLDLVPTTDEGYYGEEGCVELVLEGSHAHVETFSYMQLIYSEMGHRDSVYFVKEQIYEANLAFFFRKNTPWKFKFDIGILRLVESGLVNKWYNDIMQEVRSKGNKDSVESKEQALSLAHLQGPFFILLFGFASAFISFLLEILRGRRSKHA